MVRTITTYRTCLDAYEHFCSPICRELGMPQMAFNIIMLLAAYPEICTAKEISRLSGFKENVLSINIDKLVRKGYLVRKSFEGDRRKTRLECTQKAKEIVQRGLKLQQRFLSMLKEGLSAEEMEVCLHCLDIMNKNAQQMKQIKNVEEG